MVSRASPRGGVDAGLKQGFVGIDVADAGDKALIQQQRLYHAFAPLQTFIKQGRREGFIEWLWPQMPQEFFRVIR